MTMTKTFAGAAGMMSAATFAVLVVGCSGGSTSAPSDDSSKDATDPSGASLPKKADSAPSTGTPGAAGGTPAAAAPGNAAPSGAPGTPGAPATPGAGGAPGAGGTPGTPGASGTSSDDTTCCYNGNELTCNAAQCFGGYDEGACEASCAAGDFDCIIACVDALAKPGPPTSQCKPTGNKC